MGITRTGSIGTSNQGTYTGTFSIAIPADAEIIILGAGGYYETSQGYFTNYRTMTLGGTAMPLIYAYDSSALAQLGGIWYLLIPENFKGTSQDLTFKWFYDFNPSCGVRFLYGFYKGVHLTNPIKGYGGQQDTDGIFTTGELTAASGDFIAAMGWGYAATLSWEGATAVADTEDTYRSLVNEWAEVSPSGNITITVTRTGGDPDGGVMAVVLNPAGGAIDLVPAEGTQAQAADAPALTQVHILVPAKGYQVQASDAPALTQTHILVSAEGVQVQASDAPAVTQTHILAAEEGMQAEVSDTPALTQTHVLAVDEGVQVEVSDSPALTQAHALAADEGAQVQISDTPALTQAHALVAQEGVQTQISDAPVLTQAHVLVAAEGVQEQVSDQATITVGGVDLIAAEGVQAQISDTPALTQVHVLVPTKGVQAQASDSPILTQVHTLAPAKGFQAQVSDAAILDLSILLATQKGYQAQYSDSPTLTVISAKVGTDSSLWASKKGLHKPLGKKWYKPGVKGQRWYRPGLQ